MKILINFICERKIYINKKIIEISSLYDIHKIINNLKDQEISEIFCITGPGSYTDARKSISIAKAIHISKKCELFGFDLLMNFLGLFSNKNIFINEKHIWIRDENTTKIIAKDELVHYNTNEFTCNVENFHNTRFIDCKIHNIINYLDQLKHPLKQQYFDKFKNFS